MTDFSPAWLDDPHPLDHSPWCRCEACSTEFAKQLEWRIEHEDRMYEQNGPRWE